MSVITPLIHPGAFPERLHMTAELLLQTPPPADLVALQWVVIVALAGAVGILFRMLQLEQAKTQDLALKVLEGLSGSTAAIREIRDKDELESRARIASMEAKLDRMADGTKSGD